MWYLKQNFKKVRVEKNDENSSVGADQMETLLAKMENTG